MMQMFKLMRHQDVSGVSETGVVAYGCVFPNGKCALAWHAQGKPQTVTVFDSMADMEKIHLHDGATEVMPVKDTPMTTMPMKKMGDKEH